MGKTRYLDIEEKIGVPFSMIHAFCQRWKVTELALFGSVLRGDFRSDSDIDVLISFSEDSSWSLFDLVSIQNELENIFGHPIDLVERSAISRSENYIRRKGILNNAQVIYAA